MLELVKCPEHREIFIIEDGEKCWIENWDTFVYLAEEMGLTWAELLGQVQTIPFEQLKNSYPIGSTKVKKTITAIVEGKRPREIFFPDEEPPPKMRRFICMGGCLSYLHERWKEIGGDSYWANRYGWINHDALRALGMKGIICVQGSTEERKEIIRRFKDDPITLMYWCSDLGHEPDICNQPISERIAFYELCHSIDPNACVMEMFDMTSKFNGYPGWEDAFNEDTHDLLMIDCYPNSQGNEAAWNAYINKGWNFIKTFEKKHQVCPQLGAYRRATGDHWNQQRVFRWQRGSAARLSTPEEIGMLLGTPKVASDGWTLGELVKQYEFWKEKLNSPEFENPYKGLTAVSFWCWESVLFSNDQEIQGEIKQIIADMKG